MTYVTMLIGLLLACMAGETVGAALIQQPSVESAEAELASADPQVVTRALIAVTMYRLPLQERIRPLLDGEHAALARPAFLAAGGDAGELVTRLAQAEDDLDRVRIATALLQSNASRKAGLRALIELAIDSDLDAQEVLGSLGGELSREAMAQVLETLAESPARSTFFGDVELFPLSLQMASDHWLGIQRLLIHEDSGYRFLAAQWLVAGDFDALDEGQLIQWIEQPEPIARTAAATLLVRRDPLHISGEAALRAAVEGPDPLARRIAIVGVGTLETGAEDLRSLLLPSLLHKDAAVAWTAAKVLCCHVGSMEDEIVQFVTAHLEQLSHDILYDLASVLDSNEQQPKHLDLWSRLTTHVNDGVRELAVEKMAGPYRPTEALIERLLACSEDPSPSVRSEALRTLAEFDLSEDARVTIARRASELFADADTPGGAPGVRVAAAALCWKFDADRPGILALGREWLTSGDRRDASDGLELARELRAEAIPLFPLMFEVATMSSSNREHFSHRLWALGSGVRSLLLKKLESPSALDRGTALELLIATAVSDESVVYACVSLLDDQRTYQSHGLGKPAAVAVNKSAATALARFAQSNRAVAELLRTDPVVKSKLRSHLSQRQLKWVETPRPTLEDIVSRRVAGDYSTVDSLLSAPFLSATGPLSASIPDAARTELVLEYLELTERAMPVLHDVIGLAVEFLVDNLAAAETLDPRVAALLERWVTSAPMLRPEIRQGAAEALLRFDPDNAAAAAYVRRVNRTLPVLTFRMTLAP